jgi:hypothetical protein
MKKIGGALCILCVWALPSIAEDCVCEKAPGAFSRYLVSRNVCSVAEEPGETCYTVPKGAATTAQRIINVGNPHATPPVLPTVPVKYRKVVSGLVVEMDAAEKAVVDAAIAAEEARQAEFRNEIASNEICAQVDTTAIDNYFQNLFNDMQAAIAPLPAGANKDAHTNTATELGVTLRRIARFMCAKAKVRE